MRGPVRIQERDGWEIRLLSFYQPVKSVNEPFRLGLQLGAPNTERHYVVLDEIGAIKGVQSSESLIHLSTKIDRAI